MNRVVLQAKQELDGLSKETGLKTGTIRKLSASLFRSLEDKSINSVFSLCVELLEEHNWAMGVIAFDWAYKVKKQYNSDTFGIFEFWLKKYVRGWGDCDDFCTHALGELLAQNNELFGQVLKWTESPDFWIRRAAAVILINPIKQNKFHGINPLLISDRLMNDEHDLVQKGYGWMLKVLSVYDTEKVYNYLLTNKSRMPRTAFRYALEKMDKSLKEELMKKE